MLLGVEQDEEAVSPLTGFIQDLGVRTEPAECLFSDAGVHLLQPLGKPRAALRSARAIRLVLLAVEFVARPILDLFQLPILLPMRKVPAAPVHDVTVTLLIQTDDFLQGCVVDLVVLGLHQLDD